MIDEVIKSNNNLDVVDTLKNHPSLTTLMPHITSYCKKGLTTFTAGEKKVSVSETEIYAVEILERATELDNSLLGLQLAIRFVEELSMQPIPEPEVFRYHYENFVLRVVGFADRSYRLVGSALYIKKNNLESINGNRIVEQLVKAKHPKIQAALQGILKAVLSYRAPRNELIHNSAYSSRELMLFKNIRLLSMNTGSVDANLLAKEHFLAEGKQMEKTIEELVNATISLLNILQPYFLYVSKHDTPES